MMGTLIAQFGKGFEPVGGYGFNTAAGSANEAVLSTTETFISNMIALVTILAGVSFVLFFVLGAYGWITAGGDSGKIDSARNQMVNGVIGLVVVIMAYALIGLIGSILGLDLLHVADQLRLITPKP